MVFIVRLMWAIPVLQPGSTGSRGGTCAAGVYGSQALQARVFWKQAAF